MRKKQEAAGGSDSDEEERKKQELYAGGIDGRGGGSGMAVLGPSRARGRPTPPAAGDVFGRLVQSASQTNEGEYPPSSSGDPESMTITLYSNGFTVNDGPLRDPGGSTENQAFLDDILKGDVPSEIRRTRKDPTKPMTLSLSDKRKEAYKAPAYVAFSSGATLGSSSSSAVQGGASGFDPGSLPAVPVLDESQPSTTVQVCSDLLCYDMI